MDLLTLNTALYWFGMIGISVFAISGVLAAAGKRIDFFGVIVLGIVTALGGGTIRDVTLGIYPITWVANTIYLWVAIGSSIFAFIWSRYLHSPRRMLLILDGAGLSVFAITGLERAIQAGAPELVAVVMAVTSAVAGGLVRDILTGQIPLVLKNDDGLYATCAIMGATIYLILQKWFALNSEWILLLAILFTFAVRIAAILRKITLPEFRTRRS